jgi:uncharacterized repeat protein (TIGR01451 family)
MTERSGRSPRTRWAVLAIIGLLIATSRPAAQAPSGYVLLETLQVSAGTGISPFVPPAVVSTTILQAGVTYKIRASGFVVMNLPPCPVGDAEFENLDATGSQSGSCAAGNSTTFGADLGLGINLSTPGTGTKTRWFPSDEGPGFNPAHVYTISFVGLGAPISLQYNDCFPTPFNCYDNNSGTLTVQIFGQAPDLSVTKMHTGNFTQGQTGATYSLTVANAGPIPSVGLVTVTDTLPTGLAATALGGTGWSCVLPTRTCTRGDALTPAATFPPIILTVDVAGNAPPIVTNSVTVSGGGDATPVNNTAQDPTTVTPAPPDLLVSKSHGGNFTQGQIGATYSVNVSNVGGSATSGAVTVTDTLPSGLTATALAGAGWTCTLAPLSCARSDVLAAGGSYPPITLTVNVASTATASLVNTVTASGGGDATPTNNFANDPTTITPSGPDISVTKSHAGNFTQGQTGATYTITISNTGGSPTTGVVTVTDTLPSGLTATALAGAGWTCTLAPLSCARSDVLGAGTSYSVLTLTVNVSGTAAGSVTNTVTATGGGDTNPTNNTANDSTTIVPTVPLFSPLWLFGFALLLLVIGARSLRAKTVG